MAQNIIIRLPDEVEGDRELARELAAEAVSIGFDFAAMFPDREAGARHGVGYQRYGYIWTAWRTKSGAVVVRCERKVTP